MGGEPERRHNGRAHKRALPFMQPDPRGNRRRRPCERLTRTPLRRARPRNAARKGERERLRPAARFRRLQRPTHQRGLKAYRIAELIGSDRWPCDALVLAVYPVDNFDLRRAVTDHQRRFYAIPSFVELVGANYRLVPLSGPSCIVPFGRCGTVRRVGFFVDAVNAQVTPIVGLWPTVSSGSHPVKRDQKEIFATMIRTILATRRGCGLMLLLSSLL